MLFGHQRRRADQTRDDGGGVDDGEGDPDIESRGPRLAMIAIASRMLGKAINPSSDPHDPGVEPSVVAGEKTEQRTINPAATVTRDADQQRDPRAVDDPAQDVSAGIVGAEPVIVRRCLQPDDRIDEGRIVAAPGWGPAIAIERDERTTTPLTSATGFSSNVRSQYQRDDGGTPAERAPSAPLARAVASETPDQSRP